MIAPRTAEDYRREACEYDQQAAAADDRAQAATTMAERTVAMLDADRLRRRALIARRAAQTIELLPSR